MKSYGIYEDDEYFATEVSGCTNPTEKCPDCPRWNKDCEGRDKYNEIAEDVDCQWK